MGDRDKTREQLVRKLVGMRQRIGKLETLETERKGVEEKYRQLLEDMNDGYQVVQDGKIVFANRRFSEILGYEPGQLLGKSLIEFLMPDDRQAVMEQYERVMRGEEAPLELSEMVAMKRDGTAIIAEASLKPIRYEGKPAFCVITRDVTKRKQAEEKYRQLLEDINDGYALLQDGNIVFTNERYSEIFGYKPGQVIGRNITQFIAPDDLQEVMEQYIRVVGGEEETPERIELTGIKGDGTTFPIEGSVRLIEYEGKPAFGVIVRDITERKRAEETLEMRNRELAALNRIAQSLSRSMKLDDVLQIALDSVLEFMGLSMGVIFLVDENIEGLSMVMYRGISEELAELIRATSILPLGMTFSSKVAVAGKVLATCNLPEEVKPPYSSVIKRDGLRFAVGIPIKSKGKTLGVIAVIGRSITSFATEELQLLETIGGQIGVAVENAQLFEKVSEQSVTDELTGLYNRRHFYKVLEDEIYRTERYGHSFSLVMLDLNGFKGYNDRMGHTNGDIVLESLAQTLKSELRKADIAFRYGGDEFAIILPATKADRAKEITDRVRSKWLHLPIVVYPLLGNPLGFSAGIAQFPEDAETVGELIFRADAALYHSKRQGGYQSALVSEVGSIFADILSMATLDQVYALATTVDARDPYTYGHSNRVADISEEIGKNLGLSGDELANLRAASILHDIGKVGIPESILAKPAKLTGRELGLMKKHPSEGAKIVGSVNGLAGLVPIIRHHHEWYDGTGHPDGLKGEDIPIAARIISVVDAYDTMTTPRPYRSVVSQEEALEELRRCSGTQFDPKLVEALCQVRRGTNREGEAVAEAVPGDGSGSSTIKSKRSARR